MSIPLYGFGDRRAICGGGSGATQKGSQARWYSLRTVRTVSVSSRWRYRVSNRPSKS